MSGAGAVICLLTILVSGCAAGGGRDSAVRSDAARSTSAPAAPPFHDPVTAVVHCLPGSRAAWAELARPGAASSQQPHIVYHTNGAGWTPIFAEQYFPHPGIAVSADAPGSYAGPFAAIDASTAVYIDSCAPCGPPNTGGTLTSHLVDRIVHTTDGGLDWETQYQLP